MGHAKPDPLIGFDEFWKVYPKKVGKQAARREWLKLKPTPALIDQMLHTLAWQQTQSQWTKAGGQYIPHPRTYLAQHRFDDEPMATSHRSDTAQHNLASLDEALRLIEDADRKRRDGD